MRVVTRLAVAVGTAAVTTVVFAGTASAAPARTITVDPNPVHPGGSISFAGTGTGTGTGCGNANGTAEVTVTVNDIAGDVNTVVPNADGSWQLKGTVPTNIKIGTFAVTATCDYYTGSFSYTPTTITSVDSGSTTPTTTTPSTTTPSTTTPTSPVSAVSVAVTGPQLASTGTDDGPIAASGVGLAALGAAFMFAGRRRRAYSDQG